MKNRISVPSPLGLAVLLTFITFLLAIFVSDQTFSLELITSNLLFWEKGVWDLLKFAMQMILMLVLGNVLALSNPADMALNKITSWVKTNRQAVVITALVSLVSAYFNWGLSIIVSAILARKIGARFYAENKSINYPLVGAAAYSGLMVWHGGFSGSAPLKVAEPGHFLADQIGTIPVSETLLSNMNQMVVVLTLLIIPISFYFLAGRNSYSSESHTLLKSIQKNKIEQAGGETHWIDGKRFFSLSLGVFILIAILAKALQTPLINLLSINFINLFLLATCLLVYPSLKVFGIRLREAISGSTGILIQFPLYAGIMGLLKYSGLSEHFTSLLLGLANADTFPLITLFSAGVVNFFVPSGGGQWAVQGPLIVATAQELHVPVSKAIMALAYGDELTNMIQPFWALPLLAITGLKARQILKYCALIMIPALCIYALCLYLF